MKYFHVSLGFGIKDRPTWLEGFREQYDKPYPYHVTLKNETEIEEEDIPELKKQVAELVKKYDAKGLDLLFNKVSINKTSKGHCMMIGVNGNGKIRELQSDIVQKLGVFGKIASEDHRNFEENFEPHITIARHLSDRQLLQAEKELPSKVEFMIEPEKIVLTIVNSPIIEERLKENNRNYFYFKE